MYCRNRIRYCTALERTGRYSEFLTIDHLIIGRQVEATKVWKINPYESGELTATEAILCSLTGRYLRYWITVKQLRHRVVPIKWADKLLDVKFAELSPAEQLISCPQPIPVPSSY